MPFPRIQWFTNKATYSNTLNMYDFALHVSLLVPRCIIIFLIILICVTRRALCIFQHVAASNMHAQRMKVWKFEPLNTKEYNYIRGTCLYVNNTTAVS